MKSDWMKRAETRPPGPPRQGGGKRQVSIKYYLLQVQIINIYCYSGVHGEIGLKLCLFLWGVLSNMIMIFHTVNDFF